MWPEDIMFEKILAKLTKVYENIIIGDTGYLDQMPWIDEPVKGVDAKGRPFFALPLYVEVVEKMSDGTEYRRVLLGVTVFFKRYSDPTHAVWVTAGSHVIGSSPSPVIEGAIGNPDNGDVEDLIEKLIAGETVEFIYDSIAFNGKYRRTARVLRPDEITSARHCMKVEKSRLEEQLGL
jgi:hypothetical protein